jgi:hypothetical protein
LSKFYQNSFFFHTKQTSHRNQYLKKATKNNLVESQKNL